MPFEFCLSHRLVWWMITNGDCQRWLSKVTTESYLPFSNHKLSRWMPLTYAGTRVSDVKPFGMQIRFWLELVNPSFGPSNKTVIHETRELTSARNDELKRNAISCAVSVNSRRLESKLWNAILEEYKVKSMHRVNVEQCGATVCSQTVCNWTTLWNPDMVPDVWDMSMLESNMNSVVPFADLLRSLIEWIIFVK